MVRDKKKKKKEEVKNVSNLMLLNVNHTPGQFKKGGGCFGSPLMAFRENKKKLIFNLSK